jgi:hypothetical protein
METEVQEHSSKAKMVGTAGAIIAALTTVVVSAINVMPQLSTAQAASSPEVVAAAGVAEAPEPRWQIVGQLSNAASPGQPLDAEVLLLPAGSPLLTTTDAQGKFLFQGISPGGYWILVRHAESGLNARVLVDAQGNAASQSVPLPGGLASMGISLQPQAN